MRILFILALLLALPYVAAPIYHFPAPAPFSGNQFYNPYPQWKVEWLRANFHAHGRSWNGLTTGEQPNEEVVRKYGELGYAVAGLSNYQSITKPQPGSAVPIYEHGYNIRKRHQLAIGARSVEWLDFPLGQLTSHEQLIINLVKRKTDLVALAHPAVRDAYSARNLDQLTGYQLIEVANGPFAAAYQPWDAALSAGRVVWGMANDDNHDLNEQDRLAVAWNMVHSATASASDVIEALRKGYFYSVLRWNVEPTADLTVLENVEFKDGTLTITCSGRIPAFEFFGQGGVVKKIVRDRLTASYTFNASDTYVRTIIWSPRHVYLLNPILRYDGAGLPAPVATINQVTTWTWRLACATLGLVVFIYRRRAVFDLV